MSDLPKAYGSEAGTACLKWLPYGGLYLTGGLTPKNIDLISDPNGPFLAALLDKGRVSDMLSNIPVYAVMVENLGERGAHRQAFIDYEVAHAPIGQLGVSHKTKTESIESSGSGLSALLTGGLIATAAMLAFMLYKK